MTEAVLRQQLCAVADSLDALCPWLKDRCAHGLPLLENCDACNDVGIGVPIDCTHEIHELARKVRALVP